jgi:DNA-binding transcriptional regulator YhcF (GntR family)
MDIGISKESEVSLRQQVVAQVEFLIATRKLKPGEALPSVRALATRLRIHHNTVSQAFQELVHKGLLVRRRGSPMVVRPPEEPLRSPPVKDLDDLINQIMRTARKHGYTLQQLRQRLREWMLAEPPDHILALSIDSGMRLLFRIELKETLKCLVELCSPDELAANPGLAIGALVLSPPGIMPEVVSVLPKDRPAIPIIYSDAEEHLEIIRQLRQPSLIAVVSISQPFLEIARGLLSPVVGRRHSLQGYLLTGESPRFRGAADIVFCDSIAPRVVRAQGKRAKVVPYRLISPECLRQISSVMSDSHRRLSGRDA